MAINMQGAWTVSVKSKSAAFAQRLAVGLQRRGVVGAALRTQDAADVDLSLRGHRG